MSQDGVWTRWRESRLGGALLVYLGASWVVLEVVQYLEEDFALPDWTSRVALVFLLLGLPVVVATAWVQSRAGLREREVTDEVPEAWELDPRDFFRSIARGNLPHLNWARALAGGLAAAVLLLAAVGAASLLGFGGRGAASTALDAASGDENGARPAVAILPFEILAGDTVWGEGMVHVLATNLDGVGGLRTINPRTLLSQWDESFGGAARVSQEDALAVARSLGARWAVDGRVLPSGSGAVVAADLYEVASGARLGTVQVEGALDGLHTLTESLSVGLFNEIMDRTPGAEAVRIPRVLTPSAQALRLYVEGQRAYRRSEFDAAVEAFEGAVEADTAFAQAIWALSDARGWRGGVGAEERELLDRAVAHGDRLSDRERTLLDAYHALYLGSAWAVDSLEAAVRRWPEDARAWYILGEAYYHARHPDFPAPRAPGAFARAIELEPGMASYRLHPLEDAFVHPEDSLHLRETLEQFREVASGDSDYRDVLDLYEALVGDSATRAAAIDRLVAAPPGGAVDGYLLTEAHPRLWPIQLRRNRSPSTRAPAAFTYDLMRQSGRLRETLTAAAEIDGEYADDCVIAYTLTEGVELEGVLLEGRTGPVASADPRLIQCRAMTAAVLEDTATVHWGLARIDSLFEGENRDAVAGIPQGATVDGAPPFEAVRGPGNVAFMHRARRDVVRGLRAWRAGDPDGALTLLEPVAWTIWPLALGDLYLELGRFEDAERVFLARARGNTYGRYGLARAQELLGKRDEARTNYRYVLEAWAGADPEYGRLVEDVRERLAVLSAEGGG